MESRFTWKHEYWRSSKILKRSSLKGIRRSSQNEKTAKTCNNSWGRIFNEIEGILIEFKEFREDNVIVYLIFFFSV